MREPALSGGTALLDRGEWDMKITEVKVFPVSEEKLKAFVSIVLDGCFMVNDIKVIRGKDGLFISMPSRKKKNGEFKDVAHPLNNETRQMIEGFVLDEYERVLWERGEVPEAGRRQLPVDEGEPGDRAEAGRPEAEPATGGERRPEPGGAGPDATPAAARESRRGPEPGERADRAERKERDEEPEDKEKSLEEIQEMHLRDSFWSVS
jgi:stage V sporulation protein G